MEATPEVDYVLVDLEPLHKERWRSDTLRLVCAEFPPHTTFLWHQHLNYGIYVVMAPLDVREQPYGEKPRPLVQSKGAVFCRDHTKYKLIHVTTTNELPAFIIEVEFWERGLEKLDVSFLALGWEREARQRFNLHGCSFQIAGVGEPPAGLKEKADVKPNANLPLHAARCPGLDLLYNEPECRVYRITLLGVSSDHEAEVSLTLLTEAVLLALEDCDVEVTSIADKSARQVSLKIGDDVHLNAGEVELKLLSSSVKKTQFVLAEVY